MPQAPRHVVLTDLMMPGMSGIELLRRCKKVAPDTEVVVMTAYGTVETAVQAMREGAYDFVEKPLKRMQIVKSVRKAAERQALVAENRTLRKELSTLLNRAIVGIVAGAAPRARRRDAGGAVERDRARARRERHRQGAARALHPRAQRRAKARSSPSTARRSPRRSSRPSSSATSAARSPARSRSARAASRRPRGGTLFLDEIGELSPRCR